MHCGLRWHPRLVVRGCFVGITVIGVGHKVDRRGLNAIGQIEARCDTAHDDNLVEIINGSHPCAWSTLCRRATKNRGGQRDGAVAVALEGNDDEPCEGRRPGDCCRAQTAASGSAWRAHALTRGPGALLHAVRGALTRASQLG
jgi:hypothetical protein